MAKPRSSKVSTTAPCGTSMETAILSGTLPLFFVSHAHNSASPSPLWANDLSTTMTPLPSRRQTWCLSVAQSMPANLSKFIAFLLSCLGPPLRRTFPVLALAGATPHRLSAAAVPPGHASPPQVLETQGAMGRSRKARPIRKNDTIRSSADRILWITLRVTHKTTTTSTFYVRVVNLNGTGRGPVPRVFEQTVTIDI